MERIILLWVLMLYACTLAAQNVDYKPFPQWAWGKEDSTEYYLYTPTGLELGKKYPIALFMHGCCGQDLQATPRNAVDPPVRMWHNFGANEQTVSTYIITAKTDRGWSKHFENLKKVIEFLIEKRQGDPQRVYVTGFSMGGRGTFEFISKYPDLFAAALPMGMSFFNGDFDKVKDIPIWANQGETDWWARELPQFIKETRALNGFARDTALMWLTGVNPRYTSFEGVGHGVQWHAASTQDLTAWAYSRVNDGNKYPQVFFVSPEYREAGQPNRDFTVEVNARDPDGAIARVDLFVNKQFHSTLTQSPYKTTVQPVGGDNLLEAIAFDEKGKSSTATTILAVDNRPEFPVGSLPYARAGAYYSYWLPASGNGPLTFSATSLPKGLMLLEDGLLRGIPQETGDLMVKAEVEDIDGDKVSLSLPIQVKESRKGEVLLRNVSDAGGQPLPVSKMIYNETPNFNRKAEPSSFIGEINFSNLAGYYGLTFIKSEISDSTLAGEEYLSFETDQPVEVLVGYEKFDNLYTSTHPAWLDGFRKDKQSEVVAQYRYFDVYGKRFAPGKITLSGADKKNNGVQFNYFVMVRADGFDNHPEINISQLPAGREKTYYQQSLSALYGHGKLQWSLAEGHLPEGLELNRKGLISGIPVKSGESSFTVEVVDEIGQTSSKAVKLEIK